MYTGALRLELATGRVLYVLGVGSLLKSSNNLPSSLPLSLPLSPSCSPPPSAPTMFGSAPPYAKKLVYTGLPDPPYSTVHCFEVTNGSLSVSLLDYGATLRSVRVPDRDGNLGEVTLHSNKLGKNEMYMGVTVGRVANRVANGKFTLDGEVRGLSMEGREGRRAGASFLSRPCACGKSGDGSYSIFIFRMSGHGYCSCSRRTQLPLTDASSKSNLPHSLTYITGIYAGDQQRAQPPSRRHRRLRQADVGRQDV